MSRRPFFIITDEHVLQEDGVIAADLLNCAVVRQRFGRDLNHSFCGSDSHTSNDAVWLSGPSEPRSEARLGFVFSNAHRKSVWWNRVKLKQQNTDVETQTSPNRVKAGWKKSSRVRACVCGCGLVLQPTHHCDFS